MNSKSLQSTIAGLSPYYTEGNIIMALKSDNGKRTVWVIVESGDDVDVYKNFFDRNNVKVMSSEDDKGKKGYANVETIVNNISGNYKAMILGIRDTDYTRYDANAANFPNGVFGTDNRDLEMMMIKSKSVINALCKWFNGFNLIFEKAQPVIHFWGKLRIYNYVENKGYNFNKHFKTGLIWDQNSHSIFDDWEKIMSDKFINNIPGGNLNDFYDFVNSKNLDNEDFYNVGRGHDLIKLLALLMIKKEFNADAIMKMTKNSYSFDDFKDTCLFCNIKNWAVKNKYPSIFIS